MRVVWVENTHQLQGQRLRKRTELQNSWCNGAWSVSKSVLGKPLTSYRCNEKHWLTMVPLTAPL